MTPQGWVALVILVAAVVLLVKKWLPLELTALSIPVVLYLSGLLTESADCFSGFSNPAVLALGAVFVIGAGLREAGVTSVAAAGLERVAKGDETRLLLATMSMAAMVSAFLSNAATTAVMTPAVVALSRRTSIPPSRLLIPLAFATVLGGNLTQVSTASNVFLGDWSRDQGLTSVAFFDFAKAGLPITVAGILFMVLVGRRFLPTRSPDDRLRQVRLPEHVARSYDIPDTLFRMRIVQHSRVRGRTVAETGLRARYGLDLLAVMRRRKVGHEVLEATPDLVLASGDELYVEGSDEKAWEFAEEEIVQFGLAGPDEVSHLAGRGIVLGEVALPPRSRVAGQSVRQLDFRARNGLTVLALWRNGEIVREAFADTPLEVGDALLVSGPAEKLQGLAGDPDYMVLSDSPPREDLSRAPRAVACLALAVLPPVLWGTPLAFSALAASLLMIGTGCLSLAQAYRAIDWTVLFLLIGTIPLGLALEQHGVAKTVAEGLLEMTGPLGPMALMASLFVLAAGAAITMSNAAAASLIAPIALVAARQANLPEGPVLLAVAHGCSCAYVLPYHQWNLIVMGPGDYQPNDFLRVGIPHSIVVTVAALAALYFMTR
ncbi:MAG: SLC13 family permease [Acidobacteriota bacterium]